MDYHKELERLKEMEAQVASEFWKPEAGRYKIKALAEIEDAEPFIEEGKEPQLRKQLRISINGKDHMWSMPFGKTPASTYGQLVSLGTIKGKLTGTDFEAVVVGSGQNRRITILA